MSYLLRTFLVILLFFCLATNAAAADLPAKNTEFSHFSLILPPDWDGDEQTGFINENPAEYLLTVGRKDVEGDNFLAQVSIYLLPNRQGVDAESAARTLADAQGESTPPQKDGNLWSFSGEPRTRTIKGLATTWVNTNPDLMLIIIAQDPQNLGADKIVQSLHGLTPQAAQLLGR